MDANTCLQSTHLHMLRELTADIDAEPGLTERDICPFKEGPVLLPKFTANSITQFRQKLQDKDSGHCLL
jgi:hypothetical protein